MATRHAEHAHVVGEQPGERQVVDGRDQLSRRQVPAGAEDDQRGRVGERLLRRPGRTGSPAPSATLTRAPPRAAARKGCASSASSSPASRAAPRTPASLPWRASRISVRSPTPGRAKRRATSVAGPRSSSPGDRDAAPDHDLVGIEGVERVGDPDPEALPERAQRLDRLGIAGLRRLDRVVAVDRPRPRPPASRAPRRGCGRRSGPRGGPGPARRPATRASRAAGTRRPGARPRRGPRRPGCGRARRRRRWRPGRRGPPSTSPPPIPVPTVNMTRFCTIGRPPSSNASASAATVASLSTNTGSPRRSCEHHREGRSRRAAGWRSSGPARWRTRPPTAPRRRPPTVRALRTSSTPATISSTSPSALDTSVGLTSESLSRASSSVATATFVPPTSTPISWPSNTVAQSTCPLAPCHTEFGPPGAGRRASAAI